VGEAMWGRSGFIYTRRAGGGQRSSVDWQKEGVKKKKVIWTEGGFKATLLRNLTAREDRKNPMRLIAGRGSLGVFKGGGIKGAKEKPTPTEATVFS